MDREKDAFYVVKKGDIIGVYKCLNDCQALLGSSVIFHYLLTYLHLSLRSPPTYLAALLDWQLLVHYPANCHLNMDVFPHLFCFEFDWIILIRGGAIKRVCVECATPS